MTELSTGKALPNVVVTGIAMTTALATDAENTWKLLLDSQSGIRTLEDSFVEHYDLPVRIGGHLLEDFDHGLTRAERHRMGWLPKMTTVLSRRGVGERRLARSRPQPAAGVRRHRPGLGRANRLQLRRPARPRYQGGFTARGGEVHAQRLRRGDRAGTTRQSRGADPDFGVRVGFRRYRAGLAQDRPGRGRYCHLRWCRGQDRSGRDRGFRPDAHRVVDPQRRPGRGVPPVRPGPDRHRVRRGRRVDGHRDRGARQGPGRQHPGPDHGRQHHLRRLPHGGAGPQRCARRTCDEPGDSAGGADARRHRPRQRTPPAPWSAIWPKARPSTTRWAATDRPCTRPRPRWATRWGRSARWNRS